MTAVALDHRPNRRPPRGRGAVALAILALLLADTVALVGMTVPVGDLVGGWVDADTDAEPSLIAHSVEVAEDAGSARLSLSFRVESPEPLPADLTGSVEGEGVMRFEPIAAQMTMSFAGLPGAPADAEVEIRMIGSTFYGRIPGMAEETGFDAEWFSFDLSEVTGVDAEELFGADLAGGNPAQQLDYLRGASDVFEELGTEEVRGVDATHYRVEVDLRDAVDEVPEATRELFLQDVEEMERELGTTTLPIEVWIDGAGLPRRVRFEVPATDMPDAPPGTVLVMEQEMYDYGVAVDVEPPPESDVVDITSLLRQGFGA